MNTEGRGNAGLMDAEENQKQVFPRRPQPLEIAERDFHISTAPATRGKVENQQQVFHFPTRCFSLSTPNPRKEA
jgi:hypothetical protein